MTDRAHDAIEYVKAAESFLLEAANELKDLPEMQAEYAATLQVRLLVRKHRTALRRRRSQMQPSVLRLILPERSDFRRFADFPVD